MLASWLFLAPGFQGGDWGTLWDELERLRASPPASGESEATRANLLATALAHSGDPRADLLRAEIEVLAGRSASSVALRLAALRPSPFEARELWLLADSLPLGPERGRQVLEALREGAPLSRWQLLLAWNAAVEEVRALRIPGTALPIQELLYGRYPADWSATELALTRKSLGDLQGADEVLEEAIVRESAAGRSTKELWAQRGIAALGSGDERIARDYLGRALALGSDDANLALSRLDLIEGRLEFARLGFRTSILSVPPPDWAWRGWGLALLPTARVQSGPLALQSNAN